LKLVARGIYAVVPPEVNLARFLPDPFLTAVAVRADAVFSHHSALELLGAAHSVWNQVTLYTEKRRRSLRLNGSILRFMEHPGAIRSIIPKDFGTRRVERREKILIATGPERTLVEGFRRPALVGGLEELINSAGGFSTIDLDLLKKTSVGTISLTFGRRADGFWSVFKHPFTCPMMLSRGWSVEGLVLPSISRGIVAAAG